MSVWSCPACDVEVTHDAETPLPRPHTIYRCTACQADIVWSSIASRLAVHGATDEGRRGETKPVLDGLFQASPAGDRRRKKRG